MGARALFVEASRRRPVALMALPVHGQLLEERVEHTDSTEGAAAGGDGGAEAAVDLEKMGLGVDVLTIQEVSDEEDYLNALGKRRILPLPSPDLGEDFGGSLTQCEVAYLVQHEWARSADDVLWLRYTVTAKDGDMDGERAPS